MEILFLMAVNVLGVGLLLLLRRTIRHPDTSYLLLGINSALAAFFLGMYTFALFLLLIYGLHRYHGLWQSDQYSRRIKVILGSVFFIILIVSFSIFNKNRSFPITDHMVFLLNTLGSSYILFKSVSYILDTMSGKIKTSRFIDVANYIFFFPTYLNGPMYRFDEFCQQLKGALCIKRRLAFYRILIGLIKVLLISKLVQSYTDYTHITWHISEQSKFVLSLLVYYLYIYANFSGFCDIAIGFGAAIGFNVPENFRTPFLAQNIGDFWRRWHITLSRVLLDSIFSPLKNMLNFVYFKYLPRFGSRLVTAIAIPSVCYVITFIISGFWHGSHANFIVWGIWHGVGLSIRRTYRVTCKPDQFLSNKSDVVVRAYQFSCWLLTFIYVTLGWGFFNYELDVIAGVFK